jgi:hypothetical protein
MRQLAVDEQLSVQLLLILSPHTNEQLALPLQFIVALLA